MATLAETVDRATIVLVPGLWHGGWAWARVEDRLAGRGFRTLAVTFPGQDRAPGDPTFAGHCEHLRQVLAAQEGPVVVVAHSYGGAVATQAADPSRVLAQLFVAAFPLMPGESIADVVDDRPDDDNVAADSISVTDGLLDIDRETALAGFYHDCDPQDAEEAAARLTPEDPSTRSTPVTTASWQHVHSEYVVCTDDHALTVERQRMLAARLDASSDLASGHSPMIRMPAEVADVIERLATRTVDA